jgi:cytidine deaminase
MTNEEIIKKASELVNDHYIDDSQMGQVASVLVSENDNLYSGVCIDTSSGMGFCAEHTAIASMITAGEYQVKKIVAVWKDEDNQLHVLSPCGRCREFMKQTNKKNLETEVVLDLDKSVKLKELMPYHDWWQKIKI